MTGRSPRTHRTSSRGTVEFARSLRRDLTPAEIVMWDLLRDRRLDGFKFRRQHPIGPFIADFFCAEAALVVEVDGRIHDLSEQRRRDALRDTALEDHGLRLLRVRNDDVIANPLAVAARLREALSG